MLLIDDFGLGFIIVWNVVVFEFNGDFKVDDGFSSDVNFSVLLIF